MVNKEYVLVTRHQGLVEYCKHIGLVAEDVVPITHATIDDVKGKHVIGVLPLHLAVHAASVTEIPMNIPEELRGQELSREETAKYAGEAKTYMVFYEGTVLDAAVTAECKECADMKAGTGLITSMENYLRNLQYITLRANLVD